MTAEFTEQPVENRFACHMELLTLKALANFSPGFALKPWVKNGPEILRNSEGVATVRLRIPTQLLQSCVFENQACSPGFQSKPWAEISQRFQRYSAHLEFPHSL